jgi:hypothetical protein
MRRIFGVSSQVVGAGYRFCVQSLPTQEGIGNTGAVILADVRDASNASHFAIVLGTDGSVFVSRGAAINGGSIGGTLLGRSDPCVAAGGYHHFEYKAKIDNSTGYVEVRINQVTVLNITGADTQNTANASAAQYALGRSGGPLTSAQVAAFSTSTIRSPGMTTQATRRIRSSILLAIRASIGCPQQRTRQRATGS